MIPDILRKIHPTNPNQAKGSGESQNLRPAGAVRKKVYQLGLAAVPTMVFGASTASAGVDQAGATPTTFSVCHVSVGSEGRPVGKQNWVSATNRTGHNETLLFRQTVDLRNQLDVLFGRHNKVVYQDSFWVPPGRKISVQYIDDQAAANFTGAR